MTSGERYAVWTAAGLCQSCGHERSGDGATNTRCGRCSDLHRSRQTERRERLRAAGLCRMCGKAPVSPEAAIGGTSYLPVAYCARCRVKRRAGARSFKQRLRDRRNDGMVNVPPEMVGGNAPRLVGGHSWRALLDMHSVWALQRLKERYYAACRARGERPRAYQTSRIVRETLERHAAGSFGGNRSACLRAMLQHAASPQAVTGSEARLRLGPRCGAVGRATIHTKR